MFFCYKLTIQEEEEEEKVSVKAEKLFEACQEERDQKHFYSTESIKIQDYDIETLKVQKHKVVKSYFDEPCKYFNFQISQISHL